MGTGKRYFQSEIAKLSKKEERLMHSVLHKANVERSARLKQQTLQQQQQQQYQLQLQQQQYNMQQEHGKICFELNS